MQNDLTAQEKASKVTWLLAEGAKLTTQEIAKMTGLSRQGAWYMMMRIERATGKIYCNDQGEWCKIEVEVN